jgi:iron complex transport system substrate-binding protein
VLLRRPPIAALVVLSIGLVACGDDDDAAPGTTATVTSAATATAAADTTAEPTVAAVTTTATGAPTGATRTVEGAYGPVEIPADPQRIVGDLMSLDYLRALGVDTDRFVGVFDASFFPADHYLADVLGRDDLVDPGFQFDPEIEQIAAAGPDLIVAPFDQIDGAPAMDSLRRIAPVLVVPTSESRDAAVRYGGTASFQDWRTTLRAYGAVFDRAGAAEAYIAETEDMIADLRATHGELIDATTATEMKSTPDGSTINALSNALESGVLGTILLSELGFQTPPQQAGVAVDEFGSIELSAENLDLVDGDLLFVEVREGAATYEDSPLWATLQVVQDGGVIEVGNHWEYGGAVAARVVLADIRTALDGLAARS